MNRDEYVQSAADEALLAEAALAREPDEPRRSLALVGIPATRDADGWAEMSSGLYRLQEAARTPDEAKAIRRQARRAAEIARLCRQIARDIERMLS